MGRRRKKKQKNNSAYLDPEMEEVQNALTAPRTWAGCKWPDCPGGGEPGTPCSKCGATVPKGQKTMIEFPPHARDKAKGSTLPGFTTASHSGTTIGGVWHNHTGDKVVYEADGKALYAASGNGLNEYSGKWDLIIDLASNIRSNSTFIRPISAQRFHDLKQYVFQNQVKSEVLQLEWPDMGIAPVGLNFWLTLWERLPAKTVVACMGGHGRTGTCIVALMIAAGMDFYTALDHVRKEHCNSAVESMSQEKYLHALYVDFLERLLKQDLSKEERESIMEDLQFAAANPPSFQSSKAVKKGGTGGQGTGTGTDWTAENYRQVNGVLETKMCTEPSCKDTGCRKKSHQEWIAWNPEAGAGYY